MKDRLLAPLQDYTENIRAREIPTERKAALQKIGDHISASLDKRDIVNLNFICTHNSRRSQLCQVWAQTAAFYFGISNFQAFSGGTELTAFHPAAVTALENSGFNITKEGNALNPVYMLRFSDDAKPLPCFSKLYDDSFNESPYAAVMTCAEAEENCPYIPEAEARFSLTYEDPKVADGTSEEERTYAERNRQIAGEMFYLFSHINNKS